MAFGQYNRYATQGRAIDQAQFDEGLRQHMLRVYNYMTVGLVITGLIAFFGSSTPGIMNLFYQPVLTQTGAVAGYEPTILAWIAMLAPLAFILVISFNFHKMSLSALQGLFWAFCALMGVSMMNIFLVFTGESIARVFFITAATFAASSLYGYTTKADLTKFGAFMFMGLIGIFIASIVNIFVGSSALQFAVSVIGVIVFTGLTAWDTQRIKEQYAEGWGEESNNKLAVMGALSLYLNFINLFQMLLQLLGQREE